MVYSEGPIVEFDLVGSILTEVKTPYDCRCINPNSMEAPMSNRTIKHEIKLQPSVIVILGILAVGVGAIAKEMGIGRASVYRALGS